MKIFIRTSWLMLATLLISCPAFAQSDWVRVSPTGGAGGSHVGFASKSYIYQTVVDSSLESKVIMVNSCRGVMVIVNVGTLNVVHCDNNSCSNPVNSSDQELSAGAFVNLPQPSGIKVGNAAEGDLVTLVCGTS